MPDPTSPEYKKGVALMMAKSRLDADIIGSYGVDEGTKKAWDIVCAQLEAERKANEHLLNNIEHLHGYIQRLQAEIKRLKGEA